MHWHKGGKWMAVGTKAQEKIMKNEVVMHFISCLHMKYVKLLGAHSLLDHNMLIRVRKSFKAGHFWCKYVPYKCIKLCGNVSSDCQYTFNWWISVMACRNWIKIVSFLKRIGLLMDVSKITTVKTLIGLGGVGMVKHKICRPLLQTVQNLQCNKI